MPTLNWIGKEAVINHHNDVPFRILDKQYTFDSGKTTPNDSSDAARHDATENKIIHGDNLEALKALLPEYEGRIKCIYIDPPYNTGTPEGKWIYSDNVDSPKIQKWLHEVVGAESEDLCRHDKWLCMMYPRLKLLHRLLDQDGVIFISIDNNEFHNLKILLDEIFSVQNFITVFAVENNPKGRKNNAFVSEGYEYCYIYCKDKKHLVEKNKPAKRVFEDINSTKTDTRKALTDNFGFFKQSKRQVSGNNKSNELCLTSHLSRCFSIYYSKENDDMVCMDEYDKEKDIWITSEKGQELLNNGYTRYICTNSENGKPAIPLYARETLIQKHKEHNLYFKENGTIYEKERSKTQQITSFLPNKRFADLMTESATTTLESIFEKPNIFPNPKNVDFIKLLLSIIKNKNSIILDSFAGSGTTAHAVLNLNKQDGGNRKFILVEMEDYAETITAERVRRVINGYGKDKNAVEGTGGSFSYYELGEPIFHEDNNLNEKIGAEKIREYIWYTETKIPYRKIDNSYLLGSHNGTDYYFYYKENEVTTLDKAFLNGITQKAEQYVIYADNCLLKDEFMQTNHIIFKKIPRDIRKF